ncbi:liprin-beta-2-like isoform X3 [Pristis pectinata]|uniref:liprin-beta-2-like isoform X3 n=1 Tax=Pristis pectinata TaxID=685728 RepID=UPI00223CD035|nr:liprin-beta-2-like isoform X3 [Pristis pectinata]
MASDASHMLEAALEQMDDIIAGSKAAAEYSNGMYDIASPIPPTYLRSLQILQLVEDLRLGLEMLGSEREREEVRSQIPSATLQTVANWLDHFSGNHRAAVNNETCQDRLARLESDRECLVLQVSVLTDQVEAQGEKIRDLESCLEEHQLKLNSTEGMLQQELLSRTALESQKLDLMEEITTLKIKLAGIEKDRRESDDPQRSKSLLRELQRLKSKVEELENEKIEYKQKLDATKAEIQNLQEQLNMRDIEIERLQSQLSSRASVQSDGSDREDMYRKKLKDKHQEVQKLKVGLDSLLAANEEKDLRIEELSRLLSQCKMMKQMMQMAQGSSEQILMGSSEEELSVCSKVATPTKLGHCEEMKPELSTSIHSSPAELQLTPVEIDVRTEPRRTSASLEELNSTRSPKQLSVRENEEPPQSERKAYLDDSKYQTLPGKLPPSNHLDKADQFPQTQGLAAVPSSMPGGPEDWESMAANLRETERSVDSTLSSPDVSPLSSTTGTDQFPPNSSENKKNKGLKKFLEKIRRTHSSSLQDNDEGALEFKRGGLRATAGPCLARSRELSSTQIDPSTPFHQWTTDQVCAWLEDSGLSQYVALARQWVSSGQTLLAATPQELEKELGIKHPLHRKKIQVLQKAVESGQIDGPGKLSHIWVTRWLDDIGLPQYKDQFTEARVDGRVLQYLTVNDLLFLKVTSQLHHLSIKCAIHVLHANKFHPNCLRRRPSDENHTSPSDVVQWSNHRVMEWLRSVDLAEYAPNLRGSGVHGGLVILEPRFNSETLALLLNIPPQKTLLRRHLTTHFNLLIGPEAQQEKRELIESSNYMPLNTTAKVRPKRLSFSHFGNLRKKKVDGSNDYICPMDSIQPAANGSQRNNIGSRPRKAVVDKDLSRLSQVEDSQRTVQQIGAFSEGINNLTTLLSQDEVPIYRFEVVKGPRGGEALTM